MKETIVVDSFALVSLFHKESGWERMQRVLHDLASSGGKALLNIMNWGEFYYVIRRRIGRPRAEEALGLLEQLPISIISVDDRFVKEAAEIKSDYPISYADAFCVVTAQRFNGQILTNDPEFKSVEHLVPVVWLTGK